MKTRNLTTLSLAAVAILAVASSAYAATAEPAAKAAAPAAKAGPVTKDDSAKSKLVLAKGLDGAAILKGYGKPYEIKPMEAPDKETKVEQWIYRRKVKQVTTQQADGVTMVPSFSGFSGPGATVTEVAVPEYKLVYFTIYQVTALLMVNGKLELAKQWQDQEETR